MVLLKTYSLRQTAATLNQLEWGASYLLKTIYNDTATGTNIIYQARHLGLTQGIVIQPSMQSVQYVE